MEKPFYLNGNLYDAMHEGLAHDLEFYIGEPKRSGGPVLELACGTGRITLPIARQGIEIVGLDLESAMLLQARSKAESEGLSIQWFQADCRDYDLGRKFKLVFIPFNSLLHLHDHQSYRDFFACARLHLMPEGRLIIDVFNPSVSMLASEPVRHKVLEFDDTETGERATIEELRQYDALSQVNRVTWFCSSATNKDYKVHDLHLRCLFPQELVQMVDLHGFEIEAAYGDHKQGPLVSASRVQILVLRQKK